MINPEYRVVPVESCSSIEQLVTGVDLQQVTGGADYVSYARNGVFLVAKEILEMNKGRLLGADAANVGVRHGTMLTPGLAKSLGLTPVTKPMGPSINFSFSSAKDVLQLLVRP